MLHLSVARTLQAVCAELGLSYVFEYDRAEYQIDLAILEHMIAIEGEILRSYDLRKDTERKRR